MCDLLWFQLLCVASIASNNHHHRAELRSFVCFSLSVHIKRNITWLWIVLFLFSKKVEQHTLQSNTKGPTHSKANALLPEGLPHSH